MDILREQLLSGSDSLGITLESKKLSLLLDYVRLLEKWNKSYNLTAIRDPQEMVRKHILDSLSLIPYLQEQKSIDNSSDKQRILDVGSGAGLPGIPLAIFFPEYSFTLVDSNGKKTAFLHQVVTQLKLENIEVFNGRVEELGATEPQIYDQILSRAFSSLKDYVSLSIGCQGRNTVIWAMKGKYPEDELRDLPKNYNVCGSHMLRVPGVEGERHLLKIIRADL